jgi:hypothetical protein
VQWSPEAKRGFFDLAFFAASFSRLVRSTSSAWVTMSTIGVFFTSGWMMQMEYSLWTGSSPHSTAAAA